MGEMQEYKVSYKPDQSESVKIVSNEPMDAAYKFFVENPQNKVILVEKSVINGFEFHPSEFIGNYDEAEQIILDNCPEAKSSKNEMTVGFGGLGSAFQRPRGTNSDTWKVLPPERIIGIIFFVVVVIGMVIMLHNDGMI